MTRKVEISNEDKAKLLRLLGLKGDPAEVEIQEITPAEKPKLVRPSLKVDPDSVHHLIIRAASEAAAECHEANIKHGVLFNSPHEAFAVLQEEVDELWDNIKENSGRDEGARIEALQVAAMAIKYVLMLDYAKENK